MVFFKIKHNRYSKWPCLKPKIPFPKHHFGYPYFQAGYKLNFVTRRQVTQLVIQFTHVQLNDESLAAMGQKKAGLSEVLDPDTIMCLGR